MRRLNPRYVRIAGIVFACILIVILISGFIAYSKREALLQKVIYKAKAKARNDYNLDVKIGSAHFTGLSKVAFNNVSIVPDDRDSLLRINNLTVEVKLMPLILGDVKLADVTLEDGFLSLTNNKGVKNFDFLFRKKKTNTESKGKVDLADLSYHLINQVLYKVPDNLNLKNFNISYREDTTRMSLLAQTAVIDDGDLKSTINVNNGESTWHLMGKMHASDKDIDVKLYADGKKIELPIIEKKFKAKLNADTITTRLTKVEQDGGETRIFSYWGARNLLVNHAGLSTQDIVIPNGAIEANIFIGENYLSLDSTSTIYFKKITAHPFIKYTLNPVKIYELKVNTGWLNAQDVFDSFPVGMFESLDGMKVSGKLNYALNFYMNKNQVDSLKFDSRLDKDDFKIIKFGKADLTKLNKPFTYVPYERGKPMGPHLISPENPEFTPLNRIPVDMRNAIMTAEDPSFYRHNGFVEQSIRSSIVTDFKEKKFVRGGSTISMQLVKNAFLSRNKTLSRKIEEILIVWLIENNRLMTKNRMLEVYFNIIEWGRDIYGIHEAARFYFGKNPSDLTLGESIYLASIVPNPKAGLYAFNGDGTLRRGLHGYFNLIGRLMASKGLVARDTNAYGFYNVRLREALRREAPTDTTAVIDSTILQQNPDAMPVEEPEKKLNFFQRLFGGGKKDSTDKEEEKIDTAELRKKREKEQEKADKKERKRREKQRRDELRERGLF
ncbi:transglycosylase domain-containing protein [Mucilaginibacter sp. JRF]|uniref:biosynthetic peptidoglycan transglycosylase n=1 Tax=Mucilaginibacter sp. JRF TaxID=2780088 RepID=UPI0018824F40|nr:biosynthetic peptidoglycan transglycosylase [Mucilaginibacter sp. JRF]MBE9584940.1 transglycosylase domain-containing protein [Mucilaginibacter sp. JRF]